MSDDSTSETRRSPVLGGRYQLSSRLGAGAMSTVYQAIDLQLERAVAVKVLHPALMVEPVLMRRFRSAAQVLAGLSHPNVVAVYDWGEEEVRGQLTGFLVMEYLEGGSLRAIIDRGRVLSPSQGLVVGLDACRGLDHIHRRGLVHGDLKPSNLLFGSDRRVRVADVGLSRMVADVFGEDIEHLDVGTARYMAPEQAAGRPPEPKSDVYSLALGLVESITGRLPFAGDTTVATLANRVDRLLPVSADLGPIAPVLEKAGRPNPADRSTAAEFGRSLVQIAQKMPRPAPLPLVGDGLTMFDAPPGQETTSELTRFRDPTGALTRPQDPTGAIPRDPTGGATRPVPVTGRDQSGAIQRDPTKPIPRDPSAAIPRPRVVAVDDTGAVQRDAKVGHQRPTLTFLIVGIGLIVTALLGVVAYRKWTVPSYAIPELAGVEEGTARNQIGGNGWQIEVAKERNDQYPQGMVIRTDPPSGAKLKKGSTLQLVVSDGPTLTTLPEIGGMPTQDALGALTAVGLNFHAAEEQYHEEVPAGQVISWRVSAQPTLVAGMQVIRGTTVDAVVSKGPEPRAIPDLTGVVFEDAVAVMQTQQVTLERNPNDEFSDVPAGAIMSQSVAGGQTVERGATIQVTVSKGPDVVPSPSLGGLGYDAAKAALEGAELQLGNLTGNAFTGVVIGVTLNGEQVVGNQLIPRHAVIDLEFSA